MPNGRVIDPDSPGGSHDRQAETLHADAIIAALAIEQHGRVARRQLVESGLTRHQIDDRIVSGHLRVEFPGVYTLLSGSHGWEGRWTAAVLSAGNDSALSYLAGAAHLGLIRQRPSVIDVTCLRALRSRSPLRFHRAALPADEVEVVDGIPTTTVSRTLLDLASVLSPARLALAVNEAEVQGMTSPVALPVLLDRHPRRPGAAALREILASEHIGHGGTDSELEDRFQILVIEEGLQQPITHAAIELPSGTAVVDNLWLPQRVVLELDGDKYHRTRYRRRLDLARDRALTAAGCRPMRAGWDDVIQPARLLADIRTLLGSSRRQ